MGEAINSATHSSTESTGTFSSPRKCRQLSGALLSFIVLVTMTHHVQLRIGSTAFSQLRFNNTNGSTLILRLFSQSACQDQVIEMMRRMPLHSLL